jgi:DNA-binding IclR family transcriptional regulator
MNCTLAATRIPKDRMAREVAPELLDTVRQLERLLNPR